MHDQHRRKAIGTHKIKTHIKLDYKTLIFKKKIPKSLKITQLYESKLCKPVKYLTQKLIFYDPFLEKIIVPFWDYKSDIYITFDIYQELYYCFY